VAKDDLLTDFANSVWNQRAKGLPADLNLQRAITPQELQNLKLRYAFVQIINPESTAELTKIRFIRSESSGWVILTYGTEEAISALASSAGERIFSHGEYLQAKDGRLERICSGTGTLPMLVIATAEDMVRLAKEAGWEILHIVDGHPLMCWGIWKACQDLGIMISGYVPSKEEEARYERIKRKCPNTLIMQPTPGIKL
jgi:hypothetical protein